LAASDGQLAPELRSRDLSGFLLHIHTLRDLMDGIGAPCWADGPTAAALHGIRGCVLRPPFHVLVPRNRNIHRVGHFVHQTIDLPPIDRESAEGLAAVSPTRALINMAKVASMDRIEVSVASAIEQGLTSEELLHRRLVNLRASGRHGLPRLLEVLERYELASGAQSWLEREFLLLMRAAGLRRPEPQQVLGRRGEKLIRVDFRWEDTPVVVEVLGYRWHRTTSQIATDAERMNQLILAGFVCLQFTYEHVTVKPEYVVTEVSRALRPYLASPPNTPSAACS
jgi:very-short-patch-repair endonuclease